MIEQLRNFCSTLALFVAAIAISTLIPGCEQTAVKREQDRIEKTAQAQREAVDRRAEAQKDAITRDEKAQERAIERSDTVRDQQANDRAAATRRDADAAQNAADRAKDRADR